MRPEELFKEAAKVVRPESYDGSLSEARSRLEELRRDLQQRTADIFDRIFEEFANVDLSAIDVVFDEDRENSYWTGKSFTTTRSIDERAVVEVTKRYICLVVPAEHEFNMLVSDQEGVYVQKKILVGIHDLRFSSDEGKTWGARQPAKSLDVVTGLGVDTNGADARERLGTGDYHDPFDMSPMILERTNFAHPVFEDDNEISCLFVGLNLPEQPKLYDSPFALIEAIHASLDDFEKALAETA